MSKFPLCEFKTRERTGEISHYFNVKKFLSRLHEENGCVVYRGPHGKSKGYKTFVGKGHKQILAHRLSLILFKEDANPLLVVDHICRNKECVRPSHLRQITNKANILCGVSACADNAKKTHCKRGHEFTADNTYMSRKGRICRSCVRHMKKKLTALKRLDDKERKL